MSKRQRRRKPVVLSTIKKICSSFERSKRGYQSLSLLSTNYKQKYKELLLQNRNLATALGQTKVEKKQYQDESLYYQRLNMNNTSLKSIIKSKLAEAAVRFDEVTCLIKESYYLLDEVAADQSNEEDESVSEVEGSQNSMNPIKEESPPSTKRPLERPKRNDIKPNLSEILEQTSMLSDEEVDEMNDHQLSSNTISETSQREMPATNSVNPKVPLNHDEIMVSCYNLGHNKLKETKEKSPIITTRRQKTFSLDLTDGGIVNEVLPTGDFSFLETTLLDPMAIRDEPTILINEDMELTKPVGQFISQVKPDDMSINLKSLSSATQNPLANAAIKDATLGKTNQTNNSSPISLPNKRKSIRIQRKSIYPDSMPKMDSSPNNLESCSDDSSIYSPTSASKRASKRKTDEIADFLKETRKKSTPLISVAPSDTDNRRKSILIPPKVEPKTKKRSRVTWMNNDDQVMETDFSEVKTSPKRFKTKKSIRFAEEPLTSMNNTDIVMETDFSEVKTSPKRFKTKKSIRFAEEPLTCLNNAEPVKDTRVKSPPKRLKTKKSTRLPEEPLTCLNNADPVKDTQVNSSPKCLKTKKSTRLLEEPLTCLNNAEPVKDTHVKNTPKRLKTKKSTHLPEEPIKQTDEENSSLLSRESLTSNQSMMSIPDENARPRRGSKQVSYKEASLNAKMRQDTFKTKKGAIKKSKKTEK